MVPVKPGGRDARLYAHATLSWVCIPGAEISLLGLRMIPVFFPEAPSLNAYIPKSSWYPTRMRTS